MKKLFAIIIILLLSTSFSYAKDFQITNIFGALLQSELESITEELGVAMAFNPMAPAEPLGITGFDISTEVVYTNFHEGDLYWKKIVKDHDTFSSIIIPRIHVQKGLPFNIDIGAMYVAVPDSNIKLWGLEAKYAILEGTVVTPALSVRAAYSSLEGVDDINLSTKEFDILVSKGFLMITPYAGLSAIMVDGSEESPLIALNDVDKTVYRALIGLQISPFPLVVINGEVSLGQVAQYGLKVGIRF